MSSRTAAKFRSKRSLRRLGKREVVVLNIVPMVDMFTALVFFLLLITSSVVTMRNPSSLTLPNSVSMTPPLETPVLMITSSEILLQGQPVMTVNDAKASKSEVLAPLRTQLLAVPLRTAAVHSPAASADQKTKSSRGKINIMADKSTPYSLLKKVMTTCGDVRFTDISLSVNHVPRHPE
ncbi:MAG: biopolymer transporter ExbD [Sinobacteraceae bacterium]|nr:biopolymer transporter ExbD [Nevskiaceae bacterium]